MCIIMRVHLLLAEPWAEKRPDFESTACLGLEGVYGNIKLSLYLYAGQGGLKAFVEMLLL